MTALGWALVAICGAAVALLLWCHARGLVSAAGACKVVASCAFLALGMVSPASAVGRPVLLLALCLCWLGDVLLIPRGARLAFGLGLGSFLLGHVLFGVLFALHGLHGQSLVLAALAAGGAGFAILRWLEPHVGSLLWPVRAYVVAILSMVAVSLAASVHTGDPRLGLGAMAFAVSDVAVARERFVTPSPWNPRWGLPLYYGAVLLLAASAGSLGPAG